VYWNAGVKTDASTGIGTVSFNLSDSLTSFRVLADAFSKDGALGSGISHVESVQPFSLEPKIPLHVTSGDVIHLPIGIVNGVDRELRGAEISAKGDRGLKLAKLNDDSFVLGAKERIRRLLQIDIDGKFNGTADLTISGKAGRYNDTVSRGILVQPKGFPHESAKSGLLEGNRSSSMEFTLPDAIVPGSVSLRAAVYPTPLASMTDALRALIREPYGCFEQTSSTRYPMVMAQQYFLTHQGVDPALIEKTRKLLDVAYARLRGFETRSGGYEWFGANPGNEPLTAYGLMQFTDMSQVRDVDKEMLDRTRRWLLSRRDGNGRFNQNANASHSFAGADPDTVNAYIVWALVESGQKDVAKEIAYVKRLATGSKDSYIVALAANILRETGDITGARELMGRLADNQESDGHVKGAVTSVTRSGGNGLAIETTALSVLAWMREPLYAPHAQRGMKWIVAMNKDGRFGSTQSTILALRSINVMTRRTGGPRLPVESFSKWMGRLLALRCTLHQRLKTPWCCRNWKTNSVPASTRLR
jgi:alpha-2-macroglobulin-like protein